MMKGMNIRIHLLERCIFLHFDMGCLHNFPAVFHNFDQNILFQMYLNTLDFLVTLVSNNECGFLIPFLNKQFFLLEALI
ncbi:hypothetical protein BpHYR1_022897 [Brachionus plicatilis]|uniref:Uncharacterized protein n=1 Tax=Brachionus plicatilis TaxID=10195 RepID=A0A3M7R5A6_BRAPC|nr:hypothetical protein BpHYR1_022897 [Brachionus plicatilis]